MCTGFEKDTTCPSRLRQEWGKGAASSEGLPNPGAARDVPGDAKDRHAFGETEQLQT